MIDHADPVLSAAGSALTARAADPAATAEDLPALVLDMQTVVAELVQALNAARRLDPALGDLMSPVGHVLTVLIDRRHVAEAGRDRILLAREAA